MKGKKALILASILLFLAPGIIGSREPSINQPISNELFQKVILPKEAMALKIDVIVEPDAAVYPSSRPHIIVVQPTAAIQTPKPPPVKVGSSHSVSGKPSWYCNKYDGGSNGPDAVSSICRVGYPDRSGVADYFAAAGPALRTAIGGIESSRAYVGKTVRVCNGTNNCVNVKLVDWCQCHYKKVGEKVIDLYKDAWDAIVGNGMGKVTITW